jgi:hypothetical protein
MRWRGVLQPPGERESADSADLATCSREAAGTNGQRDKLTGQNGTNVPQRFNSQARGPDPAERRADELAAGGNRTG